MNHSHIKLAKRISKKSPSKFKLGAVITDRKDRVISTGINNMRKTHPGMPTFGNFIHAELDALLGLSYDETFKGNVYVYRETVHGELAMAKPCNVCNEMLKRAGIQNIYYSTPNGISHEKI